MATAETKKKLEEMAEQAAAQDEPMGSVAAAVPRTEGSAVDEKHEAATSYEKAGPPNHAPAHKGGHGTLVSGDEAHVADKAGKAPADKANK